MTDPLFDISGKVALVTGGTSGIGAMIAEGLLVRGVRTYITGRDLGKATAIAAELSHSTGGECLALSADFTDAEAPPALAATLSKREEGLHLLVNNAGAGANGALSSATLEDWNLVLNVNLRSVFFLSRELLPLLRATATAEDPARIINVGSIGGLHVPNWEAHSYGASKAAITDVDAEATRKSIETYIPLRRAGTAQDVQGAIAFLSSRAGAFVNGHTLPLDGGYIAAL
jgi:NAD(P)-dependent dehydrogenase (short-subunit alcohol dehydrogenase family)